MTLIVDGLHLLEPEPEQVKIFPLLRRLDRLYRFGGRGAGEVSVLRHSLLVAQMFEEDTMGRKLAVVHDAPEGYTGEILSPMKAAIRAFCPDDPVKVIELGIARAIEDSLGIMGTPDQHKQLKHFDLVSRAVEKRYLMIDPADDWDLPVTFQEIAVWTPRLIRLLSLDETDAFLMACNILELNECNAS